MTVSNRLAVDIGGTFTDLVLTTPAATFSLKVLTTHDAPERGVLEGLRSILGQAELQASALDLVIHGTTLATNALIERKGARTALVTTEGFRDSLEIAYEHRFEQYDLYMERPAPLVPREMRFELPERVAADGTVLLELDEDAVVRLADELADQGVEAVAVCFLHAYENPAHEQRARELLARRFSSDVICISSEVCREIREYERTSTTVANAYVLPLMESYLARLEASLRELGSKAPLLLIMSSGGITTVETARRFPIRLVESGPAGGAILARAIAAQNGLTRALAFDMGGTTAKLTLIDDYAPQTARHFEIARASRFQRGSGIPVRIPVIDLVEIGAGGGSIARVDDLGRIAVGPDSAGSTPGPACYGRGGNEPTVTDADLLLGWLDPDDFAGGHISLSVDAASKATSAQLSVPLGMQPQKAAYGVTEIVSETMANAARVHAVENGKETTDRAMIAFGGAAPLHAARLAQKLGIRRVIIPRGAGVGSAHGFLEAPLAYEIVQTKLTSLGSYDPSVADARFAAMRVEAEAVVMLGQPQTALVERRIGFMRYRGQGHEVAVSLPADAFGPQGALFLREAFEKAYRQLYGRVIPKLDIELLTWVLSLSEDRPLPARLDTVADGAVARPEKHRQLIDPASGADVDAAIYLRESLQVGARLSGPAMIAERETSTLIPAGFDAYINAAGQIVLEWTAS